MEARSRHASSAGPLPSRPATVAFAGVFAACLLAFLGLGRVLPVLPRYVTGPIGSTDVAVGLVTGAFAFTAVVCRPLGRPARRRARSAARRDRPARCSRRSPARCTSCRSGFPGSCWRGSSSGSGEGLVFTAGAAWTVDLAPRGDAGARDRPVRADDLDRADRRAADRRGSAPGGGLRRGVGVRRGGAPGRGGRRACAAGLAAPRRRPSRAPWVAREAVRPGMSLSLAAFGQAAFAGFIVLHLERRGIGHGAAVFTAFGAAVVGARVIAGRLPDVDRPPEERGRRGRLRGMRPGDHRARARAAGRHGRRCGHGLRVLRAVPLARPDRGQRAPATRGGARRWARSPRSSTSGWGWAGRWRA